MRTASDFDRPFDGQTAVANAMSSQDDTAAIIEEYDTVYVLVHTLLFADLT